MRLSDQEKQMLDGGRGDAVRKAMEILMAMGEIYGAERMVPVNSAHISGANINVTGDAGARFVEETAAGVDRLVAYTTLNPSSIDRRRWRDLAMPEAEVLKQQGLTKSYEKMGAISCHSCTPYLVGNLPRLGEHVAWCESSAISYANSVLGARTNREGGPTALASAITGRTPDYGLHLDENRGGHLLVEVKAPIKGFFDYGNLGYFVGSIAQDKNPVFTGIPPDVTIDELKSLASALASSGAVALFHIVGVTPEARTLEQAFSQGPPETTIEVGARELQQAEERLSMAAGSDVDWIYLGCPHLSVPEFGEIAALLKGKRISDKVELWACSSPAIKIQADFMGYTEVIEEAGAKVVTETCPVITFSRAICQNKGFKSITSNSAKVAHYMPGQFDILAHYGDTAKCISAALSGRWE